MSETTTLTLNISHDEDCDSPEESDLSWKLYSFNHRHGNYKDPEKFLHRSADKGIILNNAGLRAKEKAGTLFIVSCYEHSGVQWGLQGETMQCQWDTAQIAGVLVFEDDARELPKGFEARQKDARSHLETYNQWANGDCYGYELETEGEFCDGCWGYIGTEYLVEEIQNAIKYYLKANHLSPEDIELIVEGDAGWLKEYNDFLPVLQTEAVTA